MNIYICIWEQLLNLKTFKNRPHVWLHEKNIQKVIAIFNNTYKFRSHLGEEWPRYFFCVVASNWSEAWAIHKETASEIPLLGSWVGLDPH